MKVVTQTHLATVLRSVADRIDRATATAGAGPLVRLKLRALGCPEWAITEALEVWDPAFDPDAAPGFYGLFDRIAGDLGYTPGDALLALVTVPHLTEAHIDAALAVKRTWGSPTSVSAAKQESLRKLVIMPSLDLSRLTGLYCLMQDAPDLEAVPALNLPKAAIDGVGWMFLRCPKLRRLPDIIFSGSLTSLVSMMAECPELVSPPTMDTSRITSMENLFTACYKLQWLPPYDTSLVTNMAGMFRQCTAMHYAPAISMKKLEQGQRMFEGCSSLKRVPPAFTRGNAYVPQPTDLTSAFKGCTSMHGQMRIDGQYLRRCTDIVTAGVPVEALYIDWLGRCVDDGDPYLGSTGNGDPASINTETLTGVDCWNNATEGTPGWDSLMFTIENLYELYYMDDNDDEVWIPARLRLGPAYFKLPEELVEQAAAKGWTLMP